MKTVERNSLSMMIDGRINLTQIFFDSEMHLATVISRLEESGLSREDAETYAAYIFDDYAEVSDWSDDDMTETQYNRISVVDRSGNPL